ncbi:type I secretion C-terminal target domain-containing protein, partial [Ignatzschineria indica]
GKITGTTIDVEPGSQVTLTIQGTGKDGEPLTQEITTTVNKDGSYNAEVPVDFVDGDLEVTATTFDRNGNLVTDQDDLTKIDHDENPETPVQGSLDRTPGDIEVGVDAKGKITGTTIDVEPGSQVTLTIQGTGKDGEPLTQEITTTVNKDGSYNAEVPVDFVDGDLEVTATTFDRNGNLVTDQDDLTKIDHDENPETPVQGGLDRTPGDIEVEVDAKGKITGTTTDVEPGSQVTLTIEGTGKDGEPLTQEITTTVNEDGSYNAEVPVDFVDGDLEVTATTFDRNGNQVTDQDDLTKIDYDENPETPVQGGLDRTPGDIEVKVDAKGKITGTTIDVEPGSQVTLTIQGTGKDGEPLTQEITTTVNEDGSYNAEVPADFVDGDLEVTATTFDRNGNQVTDQDDLTKIDHDENPETPVQGGLDRTPGDIEVEVDAKGKITGTTTDVEPGSQVTLTIQGTGKDGEPLTQEITTTVNKDGSYNAEVPADFVDGELEVTATTFDRNGNLVTDQDDLTKIDHDENPETPVQGGLDRTPGDIEVEVDVKGKITGTTTDVEPGSQVTLTIQGTGKDGEPLTQEITTTVNEDGSYNAEVPVDFVDGELEVTATTFDRNGNQVTDQDDLTKIDHDENPETPVQGGLDRIESNISVSATEDGKITGTTKDVAPGSTVKLTITGQSGEGEEFEITTTAVVKEDGSYETEYPVDADGTVVVKAETVDRNGYSINDHDSYELEVIRDDYQDPVIEIGTNDSDTLVGTSGNDLLIGDKGGFNTNFNDGDNYNISIVIDLSYSMEYAVDHGFDYTKRLDIVKTGLKAFIEEMANHKGIINLQIAGFSSDQAVVKAFTEPVTLDNMGAIQDYIDSLAPIEVGANTQPNVGFDAANKWLEEVSPNGFNNQTYFISDGDPSVELDLIDKAFALVAEKSAVYAVGISRDVALKNVERYDNTDKEGNKIPGEWNPLYNHGVSQVFTTGDEFISYLIGGAKNFEPMDIGGDTIKGGAGDDIIFGDVINTNWIDSIYPKNSGYQVLISHLKAEVTNGEDPSNEQIYNFIKENYRKFVDADAEDPTIKGGDDIIYGGDGDDIIIAGAGDDRIYGGAGNDIISTGSGDDTIVYTLLQAADATGGNGTDTWIDYADNDKIEFSEDFFVGLLEDKSNIGDYIKLEEDDEGNAVLKVDRDGAQGDSHQWADLLVIENKTLDELDDLINKQVVIG